MEESIVQNQLFEIYQMTLQAAHRAMEDQAKSMREFTEVKSVEDLIALQMRLAGKHVERTMEFWGGMWRIAAEGPFRQSMHDATVLTSTSLASALREAAQNEQQGDERKSA
jgi:phasin protein